MNLIVHEMQFSLGYYQAEDGGSIFIANAIRIHEAKIEKTCCKSAVANF